MTEKKQSALRPLSGLRGIPPPIQMGRSLPLISSVTALQREAGSIYNSAPHTQDAGAVSDKAAPT